MLVLLTYSQEADASIQGGKFTSGKLKYSINYDSNYASLSTIKKCIERWNDISGNVKLTYTKSQTESDIDINYMTANSPNGNTMGETRYYYNGNRVKSHGVRDASVCFIYKCAYTAYSTNTCKKAAKATCTHEVGHSISLAHSDTVGNVMSQPNRSVLKPTATDKAALRKKWGN